ncbi:conserved hypothetical protein [Ixodes scapularis]|uniref:Zinc finger BED domain-containing protein 4-like n=1 Tax=Ixodes scapularis TaxID=6945 RepID=B7QMK9_IXOSC|nr:conserved hypothetical protein [Ixodes scapularis]|eukprot:XP_002399818.1 conserved hypothetical protein [Ixodes scapularis]
MKRAPCVAHCLNLVVKALLTKSGAELEETLKAARAIVGHFRHSASAQRQLEAIQLRHGLPVHKLLQDVPTKWNSTFYMVERLTEQRRAVSEFFEDSTKHYLAPRQWALLKAMATVLKPFEEATRLLCIDTSTLGQVLPLLTFIERTVTHTMTGAELDTPAFCLASCLLNELSLKESVRFLHRLCSITYVFSPDLRALGPPPVFADSMASLDHPKAPVNVPPPEDMDLQATGTSAGQSGSLSLTGNTAAAPATAVAAPPTIIIRPHTNPFAPLMDLERAKKASYLTLPRTCELFRPRSMGRNEPVERYHLFPRLHLLIT